MWIKEETSKEDFNFTRRSSSICQNLGRYLYASLPMYKNIRLFNFRIDVHSIYFKSFGFDILDIFFVFFPGIVIRVKYGLKWLLLTAYELQQEEKWLWNFEVCSSETETNAADAQPER